MSDKKPPLGIKPYYIAHGERINDLADAIKRTNDVNDIRYYISEMLLICTLIDDMGRVERKYSIRKENAND